jgi:hypothetical protein
MRSKSFLFFFILLIISPKMAESQIDIIRLEPGQVILQPSEDQGFYDADVPVRISIQATSSWSVSCIAEVLSSPAHVIPIDRILIKKEGEPLFEPMVTTIHVGSGGPSEDFQDIASLHFRVQVLESDGTGQYNGLIRFESDDGTMEAILPLTMMIEPYMRFVIPDEKIVGIDVTGAPDTYTSDDHLTVTVEGNTEDWRVKISFEDSHPAGQFRQNNIFVKSSRIPGNSEEGAGPGFMALNYSRKIANGAMMGKSGTITLSFKVNTATETPPGEYNVRLKIDSPEFPDPKYIEMIVEVSEYFAIELSESEVNIESDGPPGEYEGDRDIILKVASNTDQWEARALGENLVSEHFEIPAARLFILSKARQHKGFMSLDQERIIASGGQMEISNVSTLKVKVETTWEDGAGQYDGKIHFIVFAIP